MPQPKASPLTEPRHYRWLVVGESYIYSPRPGKGNDARRGQSCVVTAVPRPKGGPGNVRIVFEDGHVDMVPAGVLKKVPPAAMRAPRDG